MVTEALSIVYDEDSISNEEQFELENYCGKLADMLENKIKEMGLTIVDGGMGSYITKFTQDELDRMPIGKRNKNGSYELWYKRAYTPEEDKDIVVKDINGKEYDNHYWNGHCYYEYVRHDDNTCDGYPSDVEIVSWRYK